MKKFKKSLFPVFLLLMCCSQVTAQRAAAPSKDSNIFLNREYWESKPGIEEIQENMAKGHSVTQANAGGFDAVTFAIFANNPVETIEYLVENGNSVNKRTHDSRTYIFWAASRGNLSLLEYFVSKGAQLDLTDSHGYSPMGFAAATGQEDPALYDFFIAQGADIQQEKDHAGRNVMLIMAPRMKNQKILDYFIAKGIDLHSTDDDGNGIFHHAAKGGDIEFLQLLENKGVSVSPNMTTGENAIFFASTGAGNPIQVYEYLESLGLEANITAKTGQTPLHNLSRAASDLKIYEYFIQRGVDVNQVNAEGNTALLIASERNTPEVIKFLTERSSTIDHRNEQGFTALTNAIRSNAAQVVKYLISKGADAEVLDSQGNNLAYYLISSFSGEVTGTFEEKLVALSSAGVDFTAVQDKGRNLFHLAVEKNDPELLKRIHSFDIDVNAKDVDGQTPLHYAAMKTDTPEILRYLISLGADVNATTEFGETAKDLAAENELLKKNNANISFLN